MLLSQPMDEIGCLFARHAFSPFGISAQGQVEPALRRVATEIEHCENIDNHRAQSLLSLARTCELPDNPRYHLDRKTAGSGKSVAVRVDLVGRRILKNNRNNKRILRP